EVIAPCAAIVLCHEFQALARNHLCDRRDVVPVTCEFAPDGLERRTNPYFARRFDPEILRRFRPLGVALEVRKVVPHRLSRNADDDLTSYIQQHRIPPDSYS